jgi:phosphate transport system protein
MTHLESELQQLKHEVKHMFQMVITQMEKTKLTLSNFDKNLAKEIILREKRINALELKIDRDCENIIALYNPVAIDLRYVLAILKINSNLERIADNLESIAKFVVNSAQSFDKQLIEISQLTLMYDRGFEMLNDVMLSFENEDSQLARNVFFKDEMLDEVNLKANPIIEHYIINNTNKIEQALYIISTIRKLERIGDQCNNIAEEIIFYIEAKILRHKKNPAE